MENFGIVLNQVFPRIISLYEHRYPSIWFSVWFAFFNLGEIPQRIRQKKKRINRQKVSILIFPANRGVLIHSHRITMRIQFHYRIQWGSQHPLGFLTLSVMNKLHAEPRPGFLTFQCTLLEPGEHFDPRVRISVVSFSPGPCHNSMG